VECDDAASQGKEPALTDADMPPLESLDENADYSGFFSPKVSENLRQLALQKLFSSACFNVCDGLDDYAEDFTSFEKLGGVMTADLRYRMEQEAKRAAEKVKQQTLAEEKEGQAEPDPEPEPNDSQTVTTAQQHHLSDNPPWSSSSGDDEGVTLT
jgi:hypothetical protein